MRYLWNDCCIGCRFSVLTHKIKSRTIDNLPIRSIMGAAQYDWVLDIRNQVNFEFRQCETHFIKDGRHYTLQTKDLCRQANLAGINYKRTNA